MRKLTIIFLILLAGTFALEGVGVRGGWILLSFFLIVLSLREKIKGPRTISSMFVVFLAASFLSFPFSTNLVNSIVFLVLYASCFFAFLYTYNNKETIKRFIPPLIFTLSFLFSLYSLLTINYSLFPTPGHGYQFVASRFGSHNHLADFLLLPLIICFYYLFSGRTKNSPAQSLLTIIYSLLTILFLPYFLFSYSRSAYLSLMIVLAVMTWGFVKSKTFKPALTSLGLFILTITLSVLFLFSTSEYFARSGVFTTTNETLNRQNNLSYKTPFGGRGEYVREALFSILERPLLGVGPGNFVVASKEFNPIAGLWTESAHNIFLDITAENGVIAGVVFILLIAELLGRSKKNVFFYMALAMLLNFQTDYTYRIFSFMLLFFTLLGLSYSEESRK